MNTIKIEPVAVALNVLANAVSFEVLTLQIPPTTFNLNARFFSINGEQKTEVANISFSLPLADYEAWQSDAELENKCLIHLKLTKNV